MRRESGTDILREGGEFEDGAERVAGLLVRKVLRGNKITCIS